MSAIGAKKKALAAIALIAVLALSACAPGGADAGKAADSATVGQAEAGAYPVTVKHALGEVTIDQEPQRIAVIGWTTPDIVVALGRVPVAVGKNNYGADDGGYFPWFRDGVKELNGELPLALPSLERGEIDFEELLDTAPDLILATYSGITAEDYTRLSSIAPTVAYPETPWATPLEDNIKLVGQALGVPGRAGKLQASLNETIATAAKDHPEFRGGSRSPMERFPQTTAPCCSTAPPTPGCNFWSNWDWSWPRESQNLPRPADNPPVST